MAPAVTGEIAFGAICMRRYVTTRREEERLRFSTSLRIRRRNRFQELNQGRQFFRDNSPYFVKVDFAVTVNQYVSTSGNVAPRELRMLHTKLRRKPFYDFPENYELVFNQRLERQSARKRSGEIPSAASIARRQHCSISST